MQTENTMQTKPTSPKPNSPNNPNSPLNPPPNIHNPPIPTQTLPNTKQPPSQPKYPSFASLFKDNRNLSKCVPLQQDVGCEEGDLIVALEEDLLTIEDAFGHALLGFVIGGKAFPKLIQDLIKSWEVECTYSMHANGWILFQFGTEEEKGKVLRNGPYSIMGRQWMIKEVPRYFSFKDSCLSCIPLWVNLRFLPKQCWSKVLLSRIARKIGRPIAMDMVTGDKSKHEGARILVEVDLDKPVVEKISILMPDGRIWDQVVDFEIKPVICKVCKGLGHEECRVAEPTTNGGARGRSRARRSKSKKPVLNGNAKEDEAGPSKPKVSPPSDASSLGKGKEKINEEGKTSTPREVEVTKKWQMVAYKKPSPPPTSTSNSYASVVAKGSNSKVQESVVGTVPIATRPKKLVDDALPISPNTFGALFDEDERTPLPNKDGVAERVEESGSKTVSVEKSRKVRVLCEMEEEFPRAARGRSRLSLSP